MSKIEDDRQVKRRLAILRHAEEVTGNVAMTCRYYGITRQSFYTWKRRYEELGPEGLRDRSRRPKLRTCGWIDPPTGAADGLDWWHASTPCRRFGTLP